jgi:hypothetical protein
MKTFKKILGVGIFLIFAICIQIQAIRDPFEPVEFDSALLPVEKKIVDKKTEKMDQQFKIKLSGIVWDSLRPYALLKIGNHKKIIQEGTVFNNKKVLSIKEDHIVLKTNLKEIILEVGQYLRL